MNNRLPLNNESASNGAVAVVSQSELDQLVDDDLAPAERRRVLAALSDDPDGWRRCALAFLESQSWRRACRQLAAESREPVKSATHVATVSHPRRRWHRVPRLAASIATAAATLAVVFFGGLAMGRAWPAVPAPTQIAGSAQSSAQDGGSGHKEGRMIVHLLGFINVQGEDGARQAVPILAAPGLKVDAPQSPGTTVASREPTAGSPWAHGEPEQPTTFSWSPGRRVVLPADAVTIAQGQPIY